MALKPTIYKLQIALADSDRNCFEALSLVLAKHPSETLERMGARVLAYCLNYSQALEFTKGLSSTDEPDLWQHSDSGELQHWIEIGQPEEARLRKAAGKSPQVSVYAFGKSAATWWKIQGDAIAALPGVHVWQLNWDTMQDFAALLQRNAQLSVSIVGGTLYIDDGSTSLSLEPEVLHSAQ